MSSFVRGGRAPHDGVDPRFGAPTHGLVSGPRDGSAMPGAAASEATQWDPLVRAIALGQRLGAGCAIGLWLGDVLLLARAHQAMGWTRWAMGMGAALFVALTTALVLGAVLGALVGPMASSAGETVRKWWLGLCDGPAGVRHAFAAYLLGVLGLAFIASVVSYRVSLSTELAFTGPRTMAAQLTVAHLVFAAGFAFALPWSVRSARRLVDGAAKVRAVEWTIAKPWRLPALLGAAALVACAPLAYVFRNEIAALPWREAAPVPGLFLGMAAALEAPRLRPTGARRFAVNALIALEVLGLCGGALEALRLRPESTTARKLGFDRALSGWLGYQAWLAVFDFDRDGQLSMLGGGDCAPFDPRRYSGAVDIPGNGIDEDCDGTDQRMLPIGPRPRMRVGQESLPSRPTIVFVTIDALAAPRLSSLGGGATSLMPHVDALAGRSALFTHCFSQGPSTRLSFPSIFTSRWDSQLTHLFAPIHPYPIAPTDRQLQDYLNEAGYETTAVIPDSYFSPSRWASTTRGFQHVDSSPVAAGKNNAGEVTDAALRVLSTASSDRPVYLWVHYYDAHSPYEAPRDAPPRHTDEEGIYDAELTHIDHALGRLLDAVEARPEPTYLFLTADHATVFHPDPSSRRGHYGYDLYTATLHVPLIVHGPGIPPGRHEGLVSTMDVAPTIAELLRLPNEGFEGNSLLPEVVAGRTDEGRVLFHEFYLPERGFRGEDPLQIVSARNARYNLVLDRTKGMYELYDWTTDYFERSDLYEDAARSPDVGRLRSLLSTFLLRFHGRWVRGVGMPGAPDKL